MDFEYSAKVKALQGRLNTFMAEHIYPNQARYREAEASADRWRPNPVVEELKPKARAAGLWNLFLPDSKEGAGLTNLEYAPLCEIMGRVDWAPEVFNCSAPDTGNMEILERFGTEEQKTKWLRPLLEGEIRSGFAMTEPAVASSDATNIESEIRREGDTYVINGRKWWTSGAMDPRCAIFIFMGKTDAKNPDRYRQQSMVLVPRETPGVRVIRPLPVFGYDDAPHGHGEVDFHDVRVPQSNVLLGEGRGFEIAQARLGPGRIHHCMRLIGVAEVAIELMCRRLSARVAFGRPLAEQSVWLERVAEARILIDQARLLTLNAAYRMDTVGNKEARAEIAMIKVAAPNMLCRVLDWAIQAHGAAGVSDDFPLAQAYSYARTVRIVDGPDEVHRNQIGRLELRKHVPHPSPTLPTRGRESDRSLT
jgi:acyl-CoA dehydrogenase